MGTEVEGGERRTSDWIIVMTILQCAIVDVERVQNHRTVVIAYVGVGLTLVLLCFLDATSTVLHLRDFKP